MGHHEAANLAVALLRSKRPITAEAVNGWRVLSTEQCGVGDNVAAKHLSRDAQRAVAQATEAEYEWLVLSAEHLGALARGGGDERVARYCVQALQRLGWAEVLARLAARLEPALRSNFPPFTGALRKRSGGRLPPRPN